MPTDAPTNLVLRQAFPGDAAACGRICFEAFRAIANEHNFPPDFPNAESAIAVLSTVLGHGGFYGVAAELEGVIAGSNFLDERSPIAGLGPITVDPRVQNHGIGRRLMRAVMERADQRGFLGIRLVQAGYHCRSLALYTALGFDAREHLSCMQGTPLNRKIAGYTVRAVQESDIDGCNLLCLRVHGHHRAGELRDAVRSATAQLVERDGRITGYATRIAFFAHAVAETNDDLKALIASAQSFDGPGFLVPSRNGELLRWCLGVGLRVIQPLTLMTRGLYNEPAGVYLPSVLF